jgi:cytochrome P450
MSLIFLCLCLGAVVALYNVALTIYRLFLHPLAAFPGPKLAAATGWYEAYYDLAVLPRGQFMHEINRLHQIYGPIVRITPDELHIDDSTWAETLYSNPSGGIRDKYPPAAHMTGNTDGVFGTVNHVVHRRRRAAISPMFSMASVAQFDHELYDMVDILLERMDQQIRRDGCAELRRNYLAYSTDSISQFCFNESRGMLQDEDKAAGWKRTIHGIAVSTPLMKQFSWMMPMTMKLPLWPVQMLAPDMAEVVQLRRDMESQALSATQSLFQHTERLAGEKTQRPNIFHNILSNKGLDADEKHFKRIAQEGFVAIAAGSETTGRALTTATFYVLANKDRVLPRLLEELYQVMPSPGDRPSFYQLQRLPWLSACIKETLRVLALVTSRTPLISPNEPLFYESWVIPPGTPTSMTLRSILLDPTVFDRPLEFRPERWLSTNPDLERISRSYLPFGRGSRMCIGMNLGYAEMYIVLASVFRRLDLQLHETYQERDIDIVRDCFIGEVSPQTQGVRVKYAAARD